MNAEFILRADPRRSTVMPIQHPDLWAAYKEHVACFWTCEEIDFSNDRTDFESLSADERDVLKSILAFFAVADGIVMHNLGANFCGEVKVLEAEFFYKIQDFMESVHAECYSLLIDVLIRDHQEKHRLFNALENMPHVRRKADFAAKFMDPALPFGDRLVAFAAVEGILFSASFAVIYHFKDHAHSKLKGLVFSNELIARDEGLHTKFACSLFKLLERPPAPARVLAIVKEAVEVEQQFVRTVLEGKNLPGLSTQAMSDYVGVVGDMLLGMLGLPKHWAKPNPLHFMMKIGLDRKANFFEVRSSEYQKALATTTDQFDLVAAF
jgi:ribonucleoside-diphosphate reductase subunit M2